jgi:hypothetical protein
MTGNRRAWNRKTKVSEPGAAPNQVAIFMKDEAVTLALVKVGKRVRKQTLHGQP